MIAPKQLVASVRTLKRRMMLLAFITLSFEVRIAYWANVATLRAEEGSWRNSRTGRAGGYWQCSVRSRSEPAAICPRLLASRGRLIPVLGDENQPRQIRECGGIPQQRLKVYFCGFVMRQRVTFAMTVVLLAIGRGVLTRFVRGKHAEWGAELVFALFLCCIGRIHPNFIENAARQYCGAAFGYARSPGLAIDRDR